MINPEEKHKIQVGLSNAQPLQEPLPEGWKRERLGDITAIVSGTTPRTEISQYWQKGNIDWITPKDLGALNIKHIYSSERKISEIGLNDCGLVLSPKHSIILSTRAPIGYLGISETFTCTNQGCKTFIPSAQVDYLFLYYLLLFNVPLFKKLGGGSTFTEIS